LLIAHSFRVAQATTTTQQLRGSSDGEQEFSDELTLAVVIGAVCIFAIGVAVFWKAYSMHRARKQDTETLSDNERIQPPRRATSLPQQRPHVASEDLRRAATASAWAQTSNAKPNSGEAKVHPSQSESAKTQRHAASRPPQRSSVHRKASSASLEPCAEVRAVEKQLRSLMNEPLSVRKKALKDLLVEYHPDKNSQEKAKEVFQFVNNARSWFLADS